MQLRPYQEETIHHLLNSDLERECICLPTGAGKTFIFSIFAASPEAGNLVIAVHREELLHQAKKQVEGATGKKVDILTAKSKVAPNTQVVICMVETLSRRKKILSQLAQSHPTLIVDECHIGNFNKILANFSRVIGFSATPLNIKKKESLKDHYNELFVPLQIGDLIPEYLSEPEYWGYPDALSPKDFKMNSAGTDYDERYMGEILSAPKFIQVASDYVRKHCAGRRTIIYNASVEHSRALTAHLQNEGYNAHHLDGETPKEIRQSLLGRLREEQDCIISNIGVLTTGFDCPEVEVIILNRLTKSLALFIQMSGRGSRKSSIINKEKFTIIDLCNNFRQHGLWHHDRDWEKLFKKEKGEGAAPTKMCKKCGYICAIQLESCPDCGEPFPSKEHKEESESDPELILFKFHAKELGRIMEQVQMRGQNIYAGLHKLKEKIFDASVSLSINQDRLRSHLPEWCKETGKKHNQWNKDFCDKIMKEYYIKLLGEDDSNPF